MANEYTVKVEWKDPDNAPTPGEIGDVLVSEFEEEFLSLTVERTKPRKTGFDPEATRRTAKPGGGGH
jgi:hypothetical protein